MTTNPEAGMRLEDAAQALFRRAQGIYREDHDHFPLKHSWETLNEKLRDGWRSMARVAIEAAAPVPPAGGEGPIGHPVADALIAGFLHGVGREPWEDMHDYIAVCAMDYLKGERLPERAVLAARAQPPAGRCAIVPLDRAPYPTEALEAINGYATGGSTRCLDALKAEGITIAHPTEPVARDGGEALRGTVSRLRGSVTESGGVDIDPALILEAADILERLA